MQKRITYVGTKPTENAYFERTGIIWTPGMTAVVLDEFTANEMLDYPDVFQDAGSAFGLSITPTGMTVGGAALDAVVVP